MRKVIEEWKVADLRDQIDRIDFPEYQREPNLWPLVEKQRLIDSMVRRFDISSLYFYVHDDDSIDCVDGRQRIGTIMSFLGANNGDRDESFAFRILNEISPQMSSTFESLAGQKFQDIWQLAERDDDPEAKDFVERFLHYPLTVIKLSDSQAPEEFNLQFTRLNLGVILNSGEKLHAMIGDLRDECFEKLGLHAFLQETKIPTRRFAREQVAAQLVTQILSLEEEGQFTRVRHFDLQYFFKKYSMFNSRQLLLMERIRELLDLMGIAFKDMDTLRNRAITVSSVLLAWQEGLRNIEEVETFAEFMEQFGCRLRWQMRKSPLIDRPYHYLIDFQRNMTQASSERSSFEARATVLREEFLGWKATGRIRGDVEWEAENNADPGEVCRRG